ncbi:MAG: hypothetical protein C0506_06610 [Anaerolinea sp.]|nr:hypothetical protein [Anaerolinea sp.]
MDEARLKPQVGCGPSPEARARMAMQIGAAMGQANVDLSRPSAGEEAAERSGRAARAAAMAFNAEGDPSASGFVIPLVKSIAERAYATEWGRLAQIPREMWYL